MNELTGFHHAGLTVRDLELSVDWYVSVLGFQELFREEAESRRACVMTLPGGGISVGLVEHRGRDHGQGFDPTVVGLDHLAFTVASQDEMRAWAQHLTDKGVEHSGAIDVPPGEILNFKDPDGISLALFWDRPE